MNGMIILFFRKQFLSFYHQYAIEVTKFRSLKEIIFLNLSCRVKYVAAQRYLKKRKRRQKSQKSNLNACYLFFLCYFLLIPMHNLFLYAYLNLTSLPSALNCGTGTSGVFFLEYVSLSPLSHSGI